MLDIKKAINTCAVPLLMHSFEMVKLES